MSILESLAKAYDRLEGAPPFGYSSEKIGFVISLNEDGTVTRVIDLQTGDGKKKSPSTMQVPASFKRPGTTPRPFFLWDNTAFVLGISGTESKSGETRLAAFRDFHLKVLGGTNDPGLVALRRFIETWAVSKFIQPLWPEDIKDQNIVFALEGDSRDNTFLHDRSVARTLWGKICSSRVVDTAACLITGENAPIARLHPSIKGIWGGHSSGGSIVSFNLQAFNSYGHDQGDNAPISEAAAFRYATALNTFLAKGSRNRIQIGDASTVFWADASDARATEEAESAFIAMFGEADETIKVDKVGEIFKPVHRDEPLETIAPKLAVGVRFHVLGLAPNAARISIRFWFDNDFGVLVRNYQRFAAEMRIEPPPRDKPHALRKYLAETAVLRKHENVPPNLAGEWMRAILAGTAYPRTLLFTVLMRIRGDGEINALRVAMLKALIIRNFRKEAPVSLDPENTNKGYLLGRLFAAYERAQMTALGDKVNATIKDKFYGAASAQPRKVFALLEKGSANHLSKVGKRVPGFRGVLEKSIGGIMEQMSPANEPFPASLSALEQALFGLGYYHQRNAFFKTKEAETAEQQRVDR